jgi:hypothetical protein
MLVRALVLAVTWGVCFGCMNPPIASSPSNNSNVGVDTLFVHDGCTVYRFYDAGYHYYVRCVGAKSEVTAFSQVSCGKNCSREEGIQTLTAPAAKAEEPAPERAP